MIQSWCDNKIHKPTFPSQNQASQPSHRDDSSSWVEALFCLDVLHYTCAGKWKVKMNEYTNTIIHIEKLNTNLQ